MEGSGAEHVRLRLSTGALGPPWQEPEQGPQGPQAAQAPCTMMGRDEGKPSVVMCEVLPPWQFPVATLQIHPGCLHQCPVVALTHWGRPALYSRPLTPVPLLGSGLHTWG